MQLLKGFSQNLIVRFRFADINLDISNSTTATLLASETRYQYIRCVAPSFRNATELQLAVGLANGKVGLCNFVPSNENNIEHSEIRICHFCIGVFSTEEILIYSAKAVATMRLPFVARDRDAAAGHRPRPQPLRPLHHRLGHRTRLVEGELDAPPDRPVGDGALDLLGADVAHSVRRHEPQVLEAAGPAPEHADREHRQHARRVRRLDRPERAARLQLRRQRHQPVGSAQLREAHLDAPDGEAHQRHELVRDAQLDALDAAARLAVHPPARLPLRLAERVDGRGDALGEADRVAVPEAAGHRPAQHHDEQHLLASGAHGAAARALRLGRHLRLPHPAANRHLVGSDQQPLRRHRHSAELPERALAAVDALRLVQPLGDLQPERAAVESHRGHRRHHAPQGSERLRETGKA